MFLSRYIAFFVFFLFASLTAATEDDASARWLEGKHYVALPIPVATGGNRIVVTEFFSYACIHCFEFESAVSAWLERKPADIGFERVPAVFNQQWELFAKAYHVADACNVLDLTHVPFFRAIHLDRQRFTSTEDVIAFYVRTVSAADSKAGQCTSRQDFMDVFNSFGVGAAVQQSIARGRAYQASGVPTMIVNGNWRTGGQMAGSNAAMLEVVDHLILRARADAAEDDSELARP